MESDVIVRKEGKVQNYFLCSKEIRNALKSKAALMGVDASTLINVVLESWLIVWQAQPVSLGELSKTISPKM